MRLLFARSSKAVLTVVLLLLIPLITMRLYAEEKRSGTMELLLTSPLTDMQIILGKFLGALALYLVLVLITFLYVGVLFLYGNPNGKPVLANALGLLLYGAALLALGMWFSTFTRIRSWLEVSAWRPFFCSTCWIGSPSIRAAQPAGSFLIWR